MRTLGLLCLIAITGCDDGAALPPLPDFSQGPGETPDLAFPFGGGDSGGPGNPDFSTGPGGDMSGIGPLPDLAGQPPGVDPGAAGPFQVASFQMSAVVAPGIS